MIDAIDRYVKKYYYDETEYTPSKNFRLVALKFQEIISYVIFIVLIFMQIVCLFLTICLIKYMIPKITYVQTLSLLAVDILLFAVCILSVIWGKICRKYRIICECDLKQR